jgi:hypothetical protein
VDRRQSGSYRDVLASREDTRLASLGALGARVATHDPVWHSSVIAITSEPLGETTRLAQFSLDPYLSDELNPDRRDKSLVVNHKLDWIDTRGA